MRAEITDRYILWGIWINIWKWFSYKCLNKLLKNMFNVLKVIISSLFIRGYSKLSNISLFNLKLAKYFCLKPYPSNITLHWNWEILLSAIFWAISLKELNIFLYSASNYLFFVSWQILSQYNQTLRLSRVLIVFHV